MAKFYEAKRFDDIVIAACKGEFGCDDRLFECGFGFDDGGGEYFIIRFFSPQTFVHTGNNKIRITFSVPNYHLTGVAYTIPDDGMMFINLDDVMVDKGLVNTSMSKSTRSAEVLHLFAAYNIKHMQINGTDIWGPYPNSEDIRYLFDEVIKEIPKAKWGTRYKTLISKEPIQSLDPFSYGMNGVIDVAKMSESLFGFKPEAGKYYTGNIIVAYAASHHGWLLKHFPNEQYGMKWDKEGEATFGGVSIKRMYVSPEFQSDSPLVSDLNIEFYATTQDKINRLIREVRKTYIAAGWKEVNSGSRLLTFYKGDKIMTCWPSEERNGIIYTINVQGFTSPTVVRQRLNTGLG